MSKRTRSFKVEKWIKEGHGSGVGVGYKPWLNLYSKPTPYTICISEKPNQALSYAATFQTYKNYTQHYIHVKPCSIFKD